MSAADLKVAGEPGAGAGPGRCRRLRAAIDGMTLTQMRQRLQRISRLMVVPRGMRLIPLLAALAIGETSFAQPMGPSSIPPGTSTISGVLIDARTKRPIAGCNVGDHSGQCASQCPQPSDAEGAYAFSGIADGEYHLNTFAIRICRPAIAESRDRAAALRHGRCRRRSAEVEHRLSTWFREQPRQGASSSRTAAPLPARRCGWGCRGSTLALRRPNPRRPVAMGPLP